MQRDVDLLRQLLFDLERRGTTCPLDALHTDARPDSDERIRYHLRLMTDAGLVKDAGVTAAGVPCVRLAHAGQEFVELARSDARWREAKAAVLAATGGLPLAMLQTLLSKWAWRSVARGQRRRDVGSRRSYRRYVERVEPEMLIDAYAVDPDTLWDDDQVRLVRERAVRQQRRRPVNFDPDLYSDIAADLADAVPSSTLPEDIL
jgi:hypothetical protein